MSQQSKTKKGPLPRGWIAYPSRSHPGKVYFYHAETRQSVWQDGITEVFDISQTDDNIGLIDDPDEGVKLKKVLENLSATTYIPTPIQPKPSIVDQAIVRPSSPVNSPQDQRKELCNSLAPLEKHLSNLSKGGYFSDSDSQPAVSLPQPIKSSTNSLVFAPPTLPEPQKNNTTFKSPVIPENVYSGYQSHVCSPQSSNNSSLSSDSSFYVLNQDNGANFLSRTLSPCVSPTPDNHTSPQSMLQSDFPLSVPVRTSSRENSPPPSGSAGAQRRRRDKFESYRLTPNLNDNFPQPENKRGRNRSPQSNCSSSFDSLRESEIWRHMDLKMRPVDQRLPPMAERRRPGIVDHPKPFMADRLDKARYNCQEPPNFRNELSRPPNQFNHPRQMEFNNQNHNFFYEHNINGPRIPNNQVDSRWKQNYEQDNFNARNNNFPKGRGAVNHRFRNGSCGSSNDGYRKNSAHFHSRPRDGFHNNRKPAYHSEGKGRERNSHTSNVQNRLSKVQNEVRNRGIQGLLNQSDRSIVSPVHPHRLDHQLQTPNPNGAFQKTALLPSPNEMCAKFLQQPDVVKIPKLSSTVQQQYENNRLARKRRFSSSPEIPILTQKDSSFDNKGDTSWESKGENSFNNMENSFDSMSNSFDNKSHSFDSKNSSFDKSTESPTVLNHKETLNHPDSPGCSNQKKARERFSTASDFPNEATIRRTPPHDTSASQQNNAVMESPWTFIMKETSFEEEFPDLHPPTILSVGSKTKPPILRVEKHSDTLNEIKPNKPVPAKRVKFKDELEETFELDESDYISAEDKQLMKFNLYDEPKHHSNITKTSGSKNSESDARMGARSLTPAQNRLKKFQNSLREKCSQNEPSDSPMPVVLEPNTKETSEKLSSMNSSSLETPLSFPTSVSSGTINTEEPMEWDDVPLPQIIKEIEFARYILSTRGKKESDGWVLEKFTVQDPSKTEFCIVIDTNILLAGISFVASLRDTQFKDRGLPIIVFPWQVIQEIDAIKDSRSSIQKKAIAVKNFLYENFSNDHPRVRGQTMMEFEENQTHKMTADDSILACARKLNEQAKVILLTNDLNLITKAKIHGVETYTKEQMEVKITEERKSDPAIKDLAATTSSSSKTASLIDNTICALKTILLDYFTKVIEKGMAKFFGEEWHKRCVIKPPWTTVLDCLVLLERHHFSIFDRILPSSFCKRSIKDAKTLFSNHEKGKKIDLASVTAALKAILEIVEFMNAESAYRDDSLPIIDFLEDIKRRLTTSSPSRTDSKPDSANSASLPSPCLVEACGQADNTAVASIALVNPIKTPQETMVVSPLNSPVIEQRSNFIRTCDALDKAYNHCRKLCASMCVSLKIPNNFPADVEIVEKTLVKFREELRELLVFVRDLITCYQSLREAVENGEVLSTETEDIKEIGRLLRDFLNDYMDISPPIEISDEDTLAFFTMTDQQSLETKKAGYTFLDELRKLFMKCSNELKKLKIF